MRVKATAIQKLTVLDLQGNLVGKKGDPTLLDQVARHIRAGCTNLVFNMIECRNADEEGAEILHLCVDTAREARGNIKFVHLSRQIREQLKDVENLETFDDTAEAVKSYGQVTDTE